MFTHLAECPNDKCSASEDVEFFEQSIPNYIQLRPPSYRFIHNYQPQRRLECCKLIGLRKNHYISQKLDHRLGVLIIEKSEIESIPPSIIASFQPTIFRVIFSELKALQIKDFTDGTHLTELNVTHNKIENLEPNNFIYAPNIEVIDLSDNRLTEVSEYTFENIPKLRILILSNNLIVKFGFKSSLMNLEVLMLGNNSLTYLSENLLEQTYRLKEFSINNNKLNISKLETAGELDIFDMSNNPTSLNLNSKNFKIKNSNVKILKINKNAVTIDASENQINSIEVDPQTNLIELNLSKNNYTSIQNLTALKSIEKLDLSFNRIDDFNLTSFYYMTQLKELNLENSGLKIIDFGLFSQQKQLTWLDISYNDLREVNFNMLTVSIERLFIEGNALTNIDVSDISITLPQLQVLGLSNNRFTCEKLIEIRKLLVSASVEMYVDDQLMVKFSRNINGIACVNENSTETMEFSSTKLLPIHTSTSSQNHFLDTIQQKINEIEKNIRQHNNSLAENTINSKDDILSIRKELMDIRTDGDLKIIDAKTDILLSVARLFNVSANSSDVNVDLKSTIEEINKINLERYKSLSSQLKLVSDKLEDLVQSVTNLPSAEINDDKNVMRLKQNRITVSNRDDNSSVDLTSLKTMMTVAIVAIICLIFGFSLILLYKRYFKQRRYNSSNTMNTTFEQSLV